MFDRALVQNQRCRRKWGRYARRVCGSWWMDETYVKVRGEWVYLYRAVDKAGKTVDFFLSRQRDINAAKAFLRQAMPTTSPFTKIFTALASRLVIVTLTCRELA